MVGYKKNIDLHLMNRNEIVFAYLIRAENRINSNRDRGYVRPITIPALTITTL